MMQYMSVSYHLVVLVSFCTMRSKKVYVLCFRQNFSFTVK